MQRRDCTAEFSVRAADFSLSRSPSPIWTGSDRRSTVPIAIATPRRSQSQHRAARSHLSSNLVTSLSSFFFQFDRIWWYFFSGFCLCFCIEEWMILYICLAAEKMWATTRKCVFYGIFKNKTKHQKIFFKTFFEMQPNTWKYFPFPKIAFSENILHEPNTALIHLFPAKW